MSTEPIILTPTGGSSARSQTVQQIVGRGTRELEPMRLRWLMCYLLAWALTLALVPVGFLTYSAIPDQPEVWGSVVGVAAVVVLVLRFVSSSRRDAFHKAFDAWRIEVVAALDPDAEFAANRYIGEDDFKASALNGWNFNRYSGSDYLCVRGMRASNLAVDNVYTETRTVYETDSQGRTVTREVRETKVNPIFHGLILIVPAPLPGIGGVVRLTTSSHGLGGLREFQVVSPDLRRHYLMGATEPFLGHRVLTPGLQAAVTEFRQDNGFKYLPRLSYHDDLLYVLVPGWYLSCGSRPGKWSPITVSRLGRIAEQCEAALGFVTETTNRLRPV
jgi:hypothetical protein